jgi:uncharacterized cupin superfamily protein
MTDLFRDPATYDESDPPGFRAGELLPRVRGRADDAHALAVRAYELPPGESLCPYHYEYLQEWLLVLAGELDLRTPERDRERLSAGALICFPAGPDGAHQVTTPADAAAPARLVMLSSAALPMVAVYPDSDKVGVWTPVESDVLMLRRADGHVDYFDGER